MSTISRSVRMAAALLALAVATAVGTPALSAQDTTGDTTAADSSATPASNAARLDSLRERAAELRAEVVRLRIEFGIRLDRLESGLVFRIPEVAGSGRADGEALRSVASLIRRHYPEARVGVRVPDPDGTGCDSTSADPRTRRMIRRLTASLGLEANRVVPADCGRLRSALRGRTVEQDPDPAVFLLVDRSPATDGTCRSIQPSTEPTDPAVTGDDRARSCPAAGPDGPS